MDIQSRDCYGRKIETILRRSVFNTRPRDFYDVYVLSKTQKIQKPLFLEALKATAIRRKTLEQINDITSIMENLSESNDLRNLWKKYQNQFTYAKAITYDDIISEIIKLVG